MNNKYLYTPNFHNWSGINDRFIISSSENMNTFADLYNYILQNEIDGFNAESIFKNYLDAKSIELREVNMYVLTELERMVSSYKTFKLT